MTNSHGFKICADYLDAVWVSDNMRLISKMVEDSDQDLRSLIDTPLVISSDNQDKLTALISSKWLSHPPNYQKSDLLTIQTHSFSDDTLELSLYVEWHSIPIVSDQIPSSESIESVLEELLEWPTDLLDEVSFNETAINLLGNAELYEESVGYKAIWLEKM